jgi:hypothetical protein
MHIMSTMGGEDEQQRANALFEQGLSAVFKDAGTTPPIRVVDDVLSPRFQQLTSMLDEQQESLEELTDTHKRHQQLGTLPRFSALHLQIFGTGDFYRATSITANKWVPKSLEHMDNSGRFDVKFGDVSIWCHSSRSLVELRNKGLWGRARKNKLVE